MMLKPSTSDNTIKALSTEKIFKELKNKIILQKFQYLQTKKTQLAHNVVQLT